MKTYLYMDENLDLCFDAEEVLRKFEEKMGWPPGTLDARLEAAKKEHPKVLLVDLAEIESASG